MSAANEPALLRRLVEFQRTLERDASNQVERYDWGWLLTSQETGDIWVANFLEVDSTEHGADQLADAADELLGGRGMHHRARQSHLTRFTRSLGPGTGRQGCLQSTDSRDRAKANP